MEELGKKFIVELGFSREENLEFVCYRREKGVIFFDKGNNKCIRFGLKSNLKKEFEAQKKFLDFGFWVPNIDVFGDKNDYFLYMEDYMGKDVIGKEIYEGTIGYDEGFEYIYSLLNNFLESQKKTIIDSGDLENIKHKLSISESLREGIEGNFIGEEFAKNLYNKLEKDLEKQNKFALTHGDFNNWNIFKGGFIDFEDSYNGVMGFDFISLVTHQYWFPLEPLNGLKIIFSYKLYDIEKMFNLYNNVIGGDIKDNFDFLFIIRGIWSCHNISDRPDLQKFRFNRFKNYAEKYLNGESLYKYFLEEVEGINKTLYI